MDKIYKLFFEESLDVKVLLDIEANKFLVCNEQVSNMYGYTKEEFLNITPYDLSLEFKDNIQMEHKQEDILNKGYDIFATKHKTKDNRTIDVYVKSKKVEFEDKQWLFITLVDLQKEDVPKEYFKEKQKEKILNIKNDYKWYEDIKCLSKNNRLVNFTEKENFLVSLLIKHINSTVSCDIIKSNFKENISNDSLLSMIKRIRKKTSSDFISTVYNNGYVIYLKESL